MSHLPYPLFGKEGREGNGSDVASGEWRLFAGKGRQGQGFEMWGREGKGGEGEGDSGICDAGDVYVLEARGKMAREGDGMGEGFVWGGRGKKGGGGVGQFIVVVCGLL